MTLDFRKLSIFIFLISFALSCFAQDKSSNNSIRSYYDEENDRTTVVLKSIKLSGNKDDFSIGAAFAYPRKELEQILCCVVIYFTSISEKDFKFKENHHLTVWADREKFTFEEVTWQESAGGTALIIAKIAFPEEIFVGMKTEIFTKIANAKRWK